MPNEFNNADYWKGIVLFGLNAATYKMALARTLLDFAKLGNHKVEWNELSDKYLDQYTVRLASDEQPQQSNPYRLTVMERIIQDLNVGKISRDDAVNKVAEKGFVDVVPRFQTIGTDKHIVKNYFYDIQFGKHLELKDTLLGFDNTLIDELDGEILCRWSLLEGAFSINQGQFHLANDIRGIYLIDGYERKALTSNIPFLSGYQGNTCFYCCEALGDEIHVDHVLPRQVICHDEIWNLVLSHKDCNLLKSDKLVGEHFITKLIARNENIMGSNHPWKHKISTSLGSTPKKRSSCLEQHYDNVKSVLGTNYWGGSDSYNPSTDPFFRRLITVLNNK
jgi:hypothetical protein